MNNEPTSSVMKKLNDITIVKYKRCFLVKLEPNIVTSGYGSVDAANQFDTTIEESRAFSSILGLLMLM